MYLLIHVWTPAAALAKPLLKSEGWWAIIFYRNQCMWLRTHAIMSPNIWGYKQSQCVNYLTRSDGIDDIQYIPRNMHTVFALLCFVVVIHRLIFPYPSGLLHWHCGNLTIAPVPAKQPWWIWINTSWEFIMNDCITTTKQSTTKPCAYFLGYTVGSTNNGTGHLVWNLLSCCNEPDTYIHRDLKTIYISNLLIYWPIHTWNSPCKSVHFMIVYNVTIIHVKAHNSALCVRLNIG